jgi:hypothetical protein
MQSMQEDKPCSTSIKLKSKASTFDVESRAAEPRNVHSHNVPPYHRLMDIKLSASKQLIMPASQLPRSHKGFTTSIVIGSSNI